MISVVIPTLDEERALPATLASVVEQPGEWEALVVDGGSVDRTGEVVAQAARSEPRIRLLSAERGRALQLNAGAAEARGSWLLFLHADTRLPDSALGRIGGLPPAVDAGCFRQRFGGDDRLLALLSRLDNLRFRVTRVAYGDQAPFLRRRLFDRLGGFPSGPMEDVAFALALRKVTRPVLLPVAVTTDPRKFDQMGHWRALARAISLLVRFRLGREISGDPFFRDYR